MDEVFHQSKGTWMCYNFTCPNQLCHMNGQLEPRLPPIFLVCRKFEHQDSGDLASCVHLVGPFADVTFDICDNQLASALYRVAGVAVQAQRGRLPSWTGKTCPFCHHVINALIDYPGHFNPKLQARVLQHSADNRTTLRVDSADACDMWLEFDL